MIRGTSELRKKVLGTISSDDLRVYAVWVPSLPADDEGRVPAATQKLTDKRVAHYWDEKGKLKFEFQKVMKMNEPAWDVYYVYDRDAEWKNEPPVPILDMHQLRGLPEDKRLNGKKLAVGIQRLLRTKN